MRFNDLSQFWSLGTVTLIVNTGGFPTLITGTIEQHPCDCRNYPNPFVPSKVEIKGDVDVREEETFIFITLTTPVCGFPAGTTLAINVDYIIGVGPVALTTT